MYPEPDVLAVELDRGQTTEGIEGKAQTPGNTHSRGTYWRNESNTEKMHSQPP